MAERWSMRVKTALYELGRQTGVPRRRLDDEVVTTADSLG